MFTDRTRVYDMKPVKNKQKLFQVVSRMGEPSLHTSNLQCACPTCRLDPTTTQNCFYTNHRKFDIHQVNEKQQPSMLPSTSETVENEKLQDDDPRPLLQLCDENCDEIADIINYSMTNTSECELRERCAFYGVDGSGTKKEMLERLNDHESTALTVIDTFDPVGSNNEI